MFKRDLDEICVLTAVGHTAFNLHDDGILSLSCCCCCGCVCCCCCLPFSLLLVLLAFWANSTPWYTTELISRLTTKELSPDSPETMTMRCVRMITRVGLNLPLLEIRMLAPPPPWTGGLPLVFSHDSRLSLFMGGGEQPEELPPPPSFSSSSGTSCTWFLLRSSNSTVLPLGVKGGDDDAATAAAAAARLSASRTACKALAWCSAISPMGWGGWGGCCCGCGSLPVLIGGGGPGRPEDAAAAAPAWLYILNRANLVISRADSGLFGLNPGGLCLPPVLSEKVEWKSECLCLSPLLHI